MSNEPQREIEKALKACAEKRRAEADAPQSLDPVARRVLQEEVARLHSSEGGNGALLAGLRFWLRPGPVMASLFGLMALASLVVLLMPEPSTQAPFQSGQSESADASAFSRKPVTEAPTAGPRPGEPAETAGAVDSTKSLAGSMEKKSLEERLNATNLAVATQPEVAAATPPPGPSSVSFVPYLDTSPVVAPAAATPPAQASSTPSPAAPGALAEDKTREAAAENAPAATISGGGGGAGGEFAGGGRMANVQPLQSRSLPSVVKGIATQRFSQVQPSQTGESGASTAQTPILNSFEVDQTDDQLRIVDADGSVYTGFVQKAANVQDDVPAAKNDLPASDALALTPPPTGPVGSATFGSAQAVGGAAFKAAKRPSLQDFYFRVTGHSRTLGRWVLFTGTFSVPVAAAKDRSQTAWDVGGGETTLPLSQARVHGQALLGGGSQAEINAMPSQ
jgi:hypothetical protein